MTSVERLREQIRSIRAIAANPEEDLFRVDSKISGWSPAEHLDHLIKVASAVVHRARDTSAAAEKRSISFIGRIILATGWIPRGKGRSPERMRGARATAAEIEAAVAKLEESLGRVDAAMMASEVPTIPHPRFGGLTPSQGLRFVIIHNIHHLKIVNEILRTKRA